MEQPLDRVIAPSFPLLPSQVQNTFKSTFIWVKFGNNLAMTDFSLLTGSGYAASLDLLQLLETDT